MENNKLNNLIQSNLIDFSTDILEIPLDTFIDNDTIEAFPILGSIFKIIGLGKSINDKIFANKLIHFLNELKDLENDFILKEISYIDDSNLYRHKVGAKILEIINRIDSDSKPQIIGKLFKSLLLKHIDYATFYKLVNSVESIFIYDLLVLKDFDEHGYLYVDPPPHLYNFELCNVLTMNSHFIDLTNTEERFYGVRAELLHHGTILLKFGLN
ncbi:hypothetical protein [Kaistella polysaccharea]|uniref:hypothetical protein n=1 Tax=Kaistella polysaccharea TaxID=2878534 RepID=UPI001CF30EFF|nr:hypothetical protein [Kaistella polysaccharea]